MYQQQGTKIDPFDNSSLDHFITKEMVPIHTLNLHVALLETFSPIFLFQPKDVIVYVPKMMIKIQICAFRTPLSGLETVGNMGSSFPGNLTIWREIMTFHIKKYIKHSGKFVGNVNFFPGNVYFFQSCS